MQRDVWSPSCGAMMEWNDVGKSLLCTILLRLMMMLTVAVVDPAVDDPCNAGDNDSSSC